MINRSSSKVGLGLCFNFKVQTNIPPDKPVQILNSLRKGKIKTFINSLECNSMDSLCIPYLYTLTKGAKKIIKSGVSDNQQFISVFINPKRFACKETPSFRQHHKNSNLPNYCFFSRRLFSLPTSRHILWFANRQLRQLLSSLITS